MTVISVAGFRVFSAHPPNPATIRFGSFVLMTAGKVRASIEFKLNFVIREMLLKLCVTREFC